MDETTVSYYNEISGSYDGLYQDPVSRAEDMIVRSHLRKIISSNHRVLDCGCGTGLARGLLGDVELDYTGIDISEGMIRRASEKFPSSVFLEGDMADLGRFGDSSFDRLISINGSFSHVQNYRNAIKEFSRVLSPGGKMFIMAYNRYSLKRLVSLKLSAVGGYVIRNDDESLLKTKAVFWSGAMARREFSEFGSVRLSGLNICADMLRGALTESLSLRLLGVEQRLPYHIQRFAHALIIEAEK